MSAPGRESASIAIDVHCDLCGARPGVPCTTPSGKPAERAHNDRRANAEVIGRHLRYLEAQKRN